MSRRHVVRLTCRSLDVALGLGSLLLCDAAVVLACFVRRSPSVRTSASYSQPPGWRIRPMLTWSFPVLPSCVPATGSMRAPASWVAEPTAWLTWLLSFCQWIGKVSLGPCLCLGLDDGQVDSRRGSDARVKLGGLGRVAGHDGIAEMCVGRWCADVCAMRADHRGEGPGLHSLGLLLRISRASRYGVTCSPPRLSSSSRRGPSAHSSRQPPTRRREPIIDTVLRNDLFHLLAAL